MGDISCSIPTPATCLICGPSMSGKTQMVLDMIRQRRKIFDPPLERVVYVYSDFQADFFTLQQHDSQVIFTNKLEEIDKLASSNCLLVIDDYQDELVKGKFNELITRYFTKHAHHRAITVILILQSVYAPGFRQINLNTQWMCIYDFPRDRSVIMSIAKQICPGETAFLVDAYKKAVTDQEWGKLIIDLHPKHKTYKYWCRSDIFPTPDCQVYAPK
ncbi:unnamed protein product [Allacma fusca]|uniref:Uncharacterized protein n=1 Tax=Allacma fusca TaxID=39272 RepID=A0A8J2JW68_9HEXA|nr:unnamed protein product [Allacma fusca]